MDKVCNNIEDSVEMDNEEEKTEEFEYTLANSLRKSDRNSEVTLDLMI